MIDWKIQARAHLCQACARPFADKQPYFTLLFDRKHGLERLDVCAACWSAQYSQGANDRKGFISFWQGVFTTPAPASPEPIQKESAETLLRRLLQANDPQYLGPIFILAVMLERKRVFKVKAQTTEESQRVFLYEHTKSGDLFRIVDPNLQLQQLDEVQRAVTRLLEQGPIPPPPAPVEASPTPAAVEAVSVSLSPTASQPA
jgi:hypothetical protein